MTTIAWDGRMFAADSLYSSGTTVVYSAKKIYRLHDGCICACAGDRGESILFVNWYEAGHLLDQKPVLKDFYAMIVSPKHGAVEYFDKIVPVPHKGKCTGGSGWKWAKAAMDFGCDARDAVKYAAKNDLLTGGRIYCVMVR